MIVFKPLASAAFAGLLIATSCVAQAQSVIYQDDFNGSASTPLHGRSPDVDNSGLGVTWVTRTDTGLPGGTGIRWFADGSIDETQAGNGAASLAFTPQPGNVYAFTASFTTVTGPIADYWVGMGFSAGQATGPGAGADFFGNGFPDQVTGHPWMLYRNAGSGAPNQMFLGTDANPVADGANWPTAVVANPGDAVDLRMILDTTSPAWAVKWQAKKPTDAAFTNLRTASYTTNPTIRAIAIGANETIDARLTSVSLTVIPEPGTLVLSGVGLLVAVAVRRRRR